MNNSNIHKHYIRCVGCNGRVRSQFPCEIICDDCFLDVLDRLD